MNKTPFALLLAAALAPVGCDNKMDSPSDMALGSNAVSLTGVWATRVVNAQDFESMILGKEIVYITTLTRVDVTQNGKTTTSTNKVCAIELTPFKGNQTLYPEAALAAIAEETNTADIGGDGAIGATYTPKHRVQLVGWKASGNAETEALPTDPKDTRILDPDGDGKPGVTLKVMGILSGDVYAVNRSIIDLSGKIDTKDRISGTSHTEQLQVIVDANPQLLKQAVTATPNADVTKSTFTMVRLSAGNDTCAAIRQNKDTLFK